MFSNEFIYLIVIYATNYTLIKKGFCCFFRYLLFKKEEFYAVIAR